MNKQTIYLAGGCFWGLEKYFQLIKGVLATSVGYANSQKANPTYQEVCEGNTKAVETVEIIFDSNVLEFEKLLKAFFSVINPFSLNKQGNDEGEQYRSGIYFLNENSDLEAVAKNFLNQEQLKSKQKILVECQKLENYYQAESYHQNYLTKNPQGYCHIPYHKYEEAKQI